MKSAVLTRTEEGNQGTFGTIHFGDTALFTGELPDRNNAPGVSCIPEGLYECLWTYSPAFKRKMYLVNNVEGRSGIRIHPANLMGDKSKGYKSHLLGCIALGERMGSIKGQKAVLVSRPAVTMLERYMDGEPFTLEIKNA